MLGPDSDCAGGSWRVGTRSALLAPVCICLAVCTGVACTSLRDGEPDNEADSGIRGPRSRDGGLANGRGDGGGSERADGGDSGSNGKDGGPAVGAQPTPCELDAAACPVCSGDGDCSEPNPCRTTHCNLELGHCESTARKDGLGCALGAGEDGVCASGQCAQCIDDDDCAPTPLTCRRAHCTADHACSTRPRPVGGPCEGGGFCNEEAACVECALDENCGANGACVDERCACEPGFVPNASGERACNFDECARDDDNRCGWAGFGSHCVNSDEGHSCVCGPPWKPGTTSAGPQCFQGGGGATMTVSNGSTWQAVLTPTLVCSNVFAEPPPPECPLGTDGKPALGQLTWLNVCGLGPPPCNTLATDGMGLGNAARVQRANYSAALEDYGDPTPDWVERVEPLAPGDVILVDTITALGVMRIVSVDTSLTFEWATIWRDHCYAPGGASCLAECSCEGGS